MRSGRAASRVVIGESPIGSGCDTNLTEEPPMTDEMMNPRVGAVLHDAKGAVPGDV
jgi:hypothetical protein